MDGSNVDAAEALRGNVHAPMMSLEQMKTGVHHLPIEMILVNGDSRRFAKWTIHDCSMCGFPCGYLVNLEVKPGEVEVAYDSGCDCRYGHNYSSRSWEEMYSHYTMQSNDEVKRKMAAEFGITV